MVDVKTIDGHLFKKMIINGTLNLKRNYQKINNLNVFPVPDGDTGTNMQMTMMEGVRQIQLINNSSIIEISKVLSNALLIGSRGNSGVILSQFFAGFHEHINNLKKNNINAEELIDSMIIGYQKSYKSVIEPVEGTILTVLRESIDNTKNKKKEIRTIKEALQIIIENAKKSLKKTPNLLPILKEFNVVDSGGTGFIFILEGMLLYLENVELEDKKEDVNFFNFDEKKEHNIKKIKNLKYRYCTEFIIKLKDPNNFSIEKHKEKMKKYGNSLILLKYNDLLKIHIHTNENELILKKLLLYGDLIKSKIDDIGKQNQYFIEDNYKKNNNKKENKYFIITFGDSEEIKNIFKELKVDYIIDMKQKNSLIKVLDKIFNNVNSENIILLPNKYEDINILKKYAKKKNHLNIKIINTKNIGEIYIVLLTFDISISLEKNLKNIKENIKKIKVGEVMNSIFYNKEKNIFPKEHFLSIFKKKIIENNKDLFIITKNLLKKMIHNFNNFLTIFYDSNDISKKNLSKIEFFLEKKFPNLEIEKIQNDNEIYPYVFVLE
ncbi:MAG: DAK2 domain-containing protein [Candidatus Phytoplasma stylosanthis]|uniref:DAK2 domain-containing protein n=2 Tax=Candidatus Phytoplasma stylosanthis TaxID=2798314 RepID=UPI00293AC73A|nr:DAK2 domain-containing protein [Candidatus Phytoplasma stylosanthis]MDV3171103.1 DAK2 domain-containing protein [Candidatus Phytoplasma stylosanthis]MDV3173712.1 DAK2 domain-containing protein [Candidatus Phytoplasma stylosanthis]MDV3174321.1 DAK2 domain-containing protein [Candidatus Phytoplasma stylosanthis]MDV3202640.1 DAK2 domain-containing protein [Candidatus Phytoplasma stylosanthis]